MATWTSFSPRSALSPGAAGRPSTRRTSEVRHRFVKRSGGLQRARLADTIGWPSQDYGNRHVAVGCTHLRTSWAEDTEWPSQTQEITQPPADMQPKRGQHLQVWAGDWSMGMRAHDDAKNIVLCGSSPFAVASAAWRTPCRPCIVGASREGTASRRCAT